MKRRSLSIAVFGGLVVIASLANALDRGAAVARANDARERVSNGTTPSLWPAFTPRLQSALKDSVSFATMSASIAQQLGRIDSVLDESVSVTDSNVIVKSRCRFSKLPLVMLLTVGVAEDGRISTLLVKQDPGDPKEYPSAFLDYVAKARFSLPFKGQWYVGWGGRTLGLNQHAASRSQRFAYDLLQVKDGKTHSGDGKSLTDYYCYGQPVLAPADGIVVTAVASLADLPIGSRDASHPGGNHVVIDHGQHEYSFLAHMQPHSVRVKPGQRVKRGDVLGLAGNSGNTSEPHLHVHLMNGPDLDDANGLPMAFDGFALEDSIVARGELRRFQFVAPAPTSKR